MILKGYTVKIILEFLLENFEGQYPHFQYAEFYKKKDYYICFDNSYGICWVEQTREKKKARK